MILKRLTKKKKKIAKNIGLLYRAKPYLDETTLIHPYLNYVNIAWASTRITKLKPLLNKQKQAVHIVFNEGRLIHSKPMFKIFNVYKINLHRHLNFMYRLGNSGIPTIFNDIVEKPEHKYPTNFSSLNYILKKVFFYQF